MWRLLSNNVVLVSQQVDDVRATWRVFLEYLYRRVATTHDLNAILFPPSSENTVRCIAV